MATATDIKGFFKGVTPQRDSRFIIPVTEEKGAPPNNMYLFKFTSPRTGITAQGTYEGSPYISFQAEVVKPENFAGKRLRIFHGIFEADDNGKMLHRFQQIGGENVTDDLPLDAAEAFEMVGARLDGEEFVGRVGKGFKKKEQRDEVRIYDYLPASDWLKVQEEGSGW